jgi:hypothetical protein
MGRIDGHELFERSFLPEERWLPLELVTAANMRLSTATVSTSVRNVSLLRLK